MEKIIEQIDFIKGEKGDKGDPGVLGKNGKDGKDGKNGKDGRDGRDGIDGIDGISPNPQEIIQEVIKQIPPPPDIPPPLNGDETIEIINSEDTEKKIKKERIEGWDELEKKSGKTIYVGGGASGGGRISRAHDLSGDLDGSTKIFALPAFWRVLLVVGSSFPYVFRPTVDYTTDEATAKITFTGAIDAKTSLAEGQTITVLYAE